MTKRILLSLVTLAGLSAHAQPGSLPSAPETAAVNPEWGYVTKAPGDSCGTYFNNYIGLEKTTGLLTEYMRTGDNVSTNQYGGRAQRFTVSQTVEVSGVEFYAYHESVSQDSVMVITSLHTYDALLDSLGPELTRDTVYVTHTAFTAVLPNISVKSYFDASFTMTDDYVIAMHSTENEELFIIANNYNTNDGNGEGLSYAYYNNPFYPSYEGWYHVMTLFAADYDYLMNPLVKFDLHESFTVLDDTICPDVVSAGCVNYAQVGNFGNHMYNAQSSTPATHLVWLWGDGFQNTDILNACHTYANSGTFDITLRDTLFRHDFNSPYCVINVTQPIVVLDLPIPSFGFTQNGLTADFTHSTTNADSIWWDFGDGTPGTDIDAPSHTYSSVGNYTVWLHAYNECFEDSTEMVIVIDDAGIDNPFSALRIYPNPANSVVIVSGLNAGTRIELLDLLGRTVHRTSAVNAGVSLSVENLSPGTYFIRITDGSGQVTRKITVSH